MRERRRTTESQHIAYSLRALGRDEPPKQFVLDNKTWNRTDIIKHDFWAATAFYRAVEDGSRAVLKIGRAADFCGLPLSWIGSWLCKREMRFYAALHDLPNVPRLLGTVGPTGFVHAFADGAPLDTVEKVPDDFFPSLRHLIDEVHRRRIAYVDTNKPQNILLAPDGTPILIDFQISYDTRELGNTWLNRKLLARLQQEDLYHLLKHKKRYRPDQMTDDDWKNSERRSWMIKVHRAIATPIRKLRRSSLKRMRDAGKLLPEGSK